MPSPAAILPNIFSILRERLWGKPTPSTQPKVPTLDVELTNACNARCTFCPREKTPQQGFMEAETFARVIKRAQELPTKPPIQLCGLGEPLLHPQVADFVRCSSAAGMATGITTNASRLTPELSRALLDAGLKKVNFSVSGIHAQYARIHGLDFERTRRNIADFVSLAGPHCRTVISVVLNELNRDDLKALKAYWQEVGIRHFLVLRASNRAGALETGCSASNNEMFLREARKLLARKRLDTLCEVPFCWVFIGWNGNYYTCCQDYAKRFPLGNTLEHSIRQVNSIKRDRLRTGLDLCRCCSMNSVNMVAEVLFKRRSNAASESALVDTLTELRARQDRLRNTSVEYEPTAVWQRRRTTDRAA
jgi:MoaA/NifB/PqqE/SkfB family radical SAM enzyme